MKLTLWLMLTCLLLTCVLSPAAELTARPLKRGINLSHWYAQWGSYDESRLATYITDDDVKLIAQMGFDHVRLTLSDTIVFTQTPGVLNTPNLERLKQRIQRFLDANVAVIVDLHPEDPYKVALRDDPKALDKFVADWGALAGAMKAFDPKRVLLEVINEPYPNEGAYWRSIQKRAIDAIRTAAPQHTIIANPGGWTGIQDLVKFKPYEGLTNVLYTFHCYDPHIYTHQAAEWGWPIAARVKNIDWPLKPGVGEATAQKTAKPGDTDAFGHVKWLIDHGELTEKWLTDRIAGVAQWQRQNGNVAVYAGEFGVYQKSAPPESRLRWLKTTRTAFESHGWGWAMWDYAGGFSVVKEDTDKKRVADDEVLKSLGLR